MNVAIIGCGLIGKKRALALAANSGDRLVVVCDIDGSRASALSKEFGCEAETNWKTVVGRRDIDIIINSSINSVLAPITVSALQEGKHVLCEKPLGRNAAEAREMVDTAETCGRLLKTGFNHCFHPGLWQAKQTVDTGGIGRVLTIRARYGHGSRPGMEREWRSSKELCGGGELLDQGVHVIDLIRWFGGEIEEVYGKTATAYWNIGVEDNACALLQCTGGVQAMFHVSWTNWRNVFSFEVFGTDGYVTVNGLGGSYGPETLEWGRRKPEGGKPDIDMREFPPEDVSWKHEWREFRAAIDEHRQPIKNGVDGLRANEVIEAIYRSSASHMPVHV